jgi:lipopolysaccharide export system permease protein
MKLNSIANRYIFREMIPPFVISMMFFTFLFLMARILFIANLVVNYDIGVAKVLLMLFFFIPYFLVFVIPMSVMMAVLLTFLRLSNDNEITALKTGGVSIYGLLPPVLLFCLIGCALTFIISVYGMPWGRSSIKKLTMEVATSNLELGLKERTFNDNFKDVMLYVGGVDLKKGGLVDVFVEDKRSENIVSTVVAPRGILLSDKDKLVFRLRLFDGNVNQVEIKNRSVNSVGFKTYDINLDIKSAFAEAKGKDRRIDVKAMSFSELRGYLERAGGKSSKYYKALLELHKKFSIPFACLALGILAVPLGTDLKSAKRSFGLAMGLGFFLFYYLLLSIGFVLGHTEYYPPFIGMWVPNIVIGGIGIYFLVRTANERPSGFPLFTDLLMKLVPGSVKPS